MNLEELTELMKTASKKMDEFIKSPENISGEKFAEKYIKEHKLEYIAEEIKAAFKSVFFYGHRYTEAKKNEQS